MEKVFVDPDIWLKRMKERDVGISEENDCSEKEIIEEDEDESDVITFEDSKFLEEDPFGLDPLNILPELEEKLELKNDDVVHMVSNSADVCDDHTNYTNIDDDNNNVNIDSTPSNDLFLQKTKNFDFELKVKDFNSQSKAKDFNSQSKASTSLLWSLSSVQKIPSVFDNVLIPSLHPSSDDSSISSSSIITSPGNSNDFLYPYNRDSSGDESFINSKSSNSSTHINSKSESISNTFKASTGFFHNDNSVELDSNCYKNNNEDVDIFFQSTDDSSDLFSNQYDEGFICVLSLYICEN
jgi:hypothetical protein